MKVFTRFKNKKRAVSPVIAVILLIGLAVAAVATIFVFILPLLQPTSNLQMDDAYIEYDDATTTAADVGEGYGKGTLILSNTGTGVIELDSLQVHYGSSIVGPWTEIENHKLTISGHAGTITGTNPYVLETLSALEEITVGFPIPEENDNNTISYKITITSSEGASFDTSTQANVAATDMQLSKDRPDISFIGTSMDNLRRIESALIRPSGIGDNSGSIKNVTYRVYSDPGGNLVQEKLIPPPSSLWTWVWDTRNDSSEGEGLDNGTYYMTMTVYDYAGLSEKTQPIYFTIDNDYTPPTINYIAPEADWAEVGDDFKIVANVVDTGCDVSQVDEVWLHYKLVNETTYRQPIKMEALLGNNYSDSIPIDARALVVNLTYYIEAIDLDDNKEYDYTPILEANDTVWPNIFHDPADYDAATEGVAFTINATITDPGLVDSSKVFLYLQKANDLDADVTAKGESLPGEWEELTPTRYGDLYSWEIDEVNNITIHGLYYYINATDMYGGNTAQHGSHHIVIPDEASPSYRLFLEGVEWTPSVSLSATESEDFRVSVEVEDHDNTFGRIVNGNYTAYATGSVTLFYRTYDHNNVNRAFTPIDLVHVDGNSTETEKSSWTGIIPGSAFDFDYDHTVNFYLEIDDQSPDSDPADFPAGAGLTSYESIDVKQAGTPNLRFVEGSVVLENNNATVSFTLSNNESSATEADATLMGMLLTVYGIDWDFSAGRPNLTTVEFTKYAEGDESYNDTHGSPHPWVNGSWLWFDQGRPGLVTDDLGPPIDNFNTIKLTFENTTGPTIDMHSMVLNVTFYVNVETVHKGNFTIDPLIATPGVEPQSAIYPSYFRSGTSRYYIDHWLSTPLYPYGSSGLGWDSEFEEPWASPSDYSRQDIASGEVKPYDGFSVTVGTGSHTTTTWKHVINNAGYYMNIDGLTGGADYQYLWFYAVILINGDITGPVTMYLGSDDETVCYINGQLAGSYGSPRGYGESQFQVASLLIGGNEDNYILFGIHEDGGGYSGGLAFEGIGQYDVKIYTGPPPGGPYAAPILSVGSVNIEMPAQNSNTLLRVTTPVDTLRESIYCLVLKRD